MTRDFILVLGPQGSGKSTQAKQLAEYLGFEFVSTGDFLRKLRLEDNNPVGQKLSQYWMSGELVPDELMNEVLFPLLEKEGIKGFVLDGYPRNLSQIQAFLSFLSMNSWSLKKVFFLNVGEEECINRIKKRADLENRPDETEEAVKRRLAIYHQETEPLLQEYEKLGALVKVNGERSVEEIQSDIRSHFAQS